MTQLSPTLQLSYELIKRQSVSPKDEGCQALMVERLKAVGFTIEHLRFGDVDNFWAVHGNEGPILCFAGHTDVVPTGPAEQWTYPPFEPTIQDGILYGRGTADMKGSLAAMLTAAERFVSEHPQHPRRLAFLITSDEEGPAINGTIKVMEWLQNQQEKITWCVVGEPSSSETIGDVVKNGRRGSLGGVLSIKGIQGHVAYPHLAANPIHLATPALTELTQTHWDEGNNFFPATSFQISNINGGTGATNVIPGELNVVFNFRFSTELSEQDIRQRTEAILNKHALDFNLQWHLNGEPFLTSKGTLIDATCAAIHEVTGIQTQLSTAGGTSDGRFIAPTGAELIELGPVNASIHKINECVKAEDLNTLSIIYQRIMNKLLC